MIWDTLWLEIHTWIFPSELKLMESPLLFPRFLGGKHTLDSAFTKMFGKVDAKVKRDEDNRKLAQKAKSKKRGAAGKTLADAEPEVFIGELNFSRRPLLPPGSSDKKKIAAGIFNVTTQRQTLDLFDMEDVRKNSEKLYELMKSKNADLIEDRLAAQASRTMWRWEDVTSKSLSRELPQMLSVMVYELYHHGFDRKRVLKTTHLGNLRNVLTSVLSKYGATRSIISHDAKWIKTNIFQWWDFMEGTDLEPASMELSEIRRRIATLQVRDARTTEMQSIIKKLESLVFSKLDPNRNEIAEEVAIAITLLIEVSIRLELIRYSIF